MTRREQAYNKMLEDLIKKVGKLEASEVDRVLALLETAAKEVSQMVATTEWLAYRIPQLKESIERAMQTFTRQYQSEFDAAGKNIWDAGIDVIDQPLFAAGIRIFPAELNREALEILQGYSSDLIGGLGADVIKKINGEITMGIMGQKSSWEVMQAIGPNLESKGVFQSVAARAEAITRTEMARVHSTSREARMQAVVDAEPNADWMKKWISSGKKYPRANHAALNGWIVKIDQPFPGNIPYPHAPGLPAKETVNCGCVHVLARKDWGDLPAKWQKIETPMRATYK